MPYLSYIADSFGIIAGLYFIGTGIYKFLKDRKKKSNDRKKTPKKDE